MKKRLIGIFILLGIVGLCGGCFDKVEDKSNNSNTKKEKVIIDYKDIKTLENLVNIAFINEKEKLKVEDYTDEQKIDIANRLVGKTYQDTTGTELINEFKKHFGSDQLKFIDIKCNIDHGSDEENIMYKYDSNQDKYIYNDNHPGHGGSGATIGSLFSFDSIEKTKDGYKMNTGVLFYDGDGFDTGPFGYGNAYKSYNDAKDKKNALVKIEGNEKYQVYNDEIPTYDMDKVLDDYKEQLDIYTFTFDVIDGNIVFKKYSKK